VWATVVGSVACVLVGVCCAYSELLRCGFVVETSVWFGWWMVVVYSLRFCFFDFFWWRGVML